MCRSSSSSRSSMSRAVCSVSSFSRTIVDKFNFFFRVKNHLEKDVSLCKKRPIKFVDSPKRVDYPKCSKITFIFKVYMRSNSTLFLLDARLQALNQILTLLSSGFQIGLDFFLLCFNCPQDIFAIFDQFGFCGFFSGSKSQNFIFASSVELRFLKSQFY